MKTPPWAKRCRFWTDTVIFVLTLIVPSNTLGINNITDHGGFVEPHPPALEDTNMKPSDAKLVLAIPNIRRFIAFRVFFNARFYYPIFAILFLDFGLTIEQFALLNVVWAATIVLFEVPSGALADIMGRKNLLVIAGVLMVGEMALLVFAPRGNPNLLFIIFLVNRILSGTAEAAASGADEALAFDTLKDQGLSHLWGLVLEHEMRLRAIAGIFAMSIGAAIYDPVFVEKLLGFFGVSVHITQAMTLRGPIVLTFIVSIFTLITVCGMKETMAANECRLDAIGACGNAMVEAFKLTFAAGHWIKVTPFAMVIIGAGLVFDNAIRMILTLSSQYYRLIELPEAAFGLIGASMAAIGLFMPRIARRLSQNHTPRFNLALIAAMTMTGLLGMTFFIPWLGLLPVFVVVSGMSMLHFFLSHYLNRITSSHQRATVLSFKGLSFNLAYGLAGMLYSLLVAATRPGLVADNPELTKEALENGVFISAMGWFPFYFVVTLAALLIFAKRILKNSNDHRQVG